MRVRSSIRRITTLPSMVAAAPPRPLTRSRVNVTSSLVTAVPSEKTWPLRSRSVSQLPSGDMVYSASPAWGLVWSAPS